MLLSAPYELVVANFEDAMVEIARGFTGDVAPSRNLDGSTITLTY